MWCRSPLYHGPIRCWDLHSTCQKNGNCFLKMLSVQSLLVIIFCKTVCLKCEQLWMLILDGMLFSTCTVEEFGWRLRCSCLSVCAWCLVAALPRALYSTVSLQVCHVYNSHIAKPTCRYCDAQCSNVVGWLVVGRADVLWQSSCCLVQGLAWASATLC